MTVYFSRLQDRAQRMDLVNQPIEKKGQRSAFSSHNRILVDPWLYERAGSVKRAQPLKQRSFATRALPWVVISLTIAAIAYSIFSDRKMANKIPNKEAIETLTHLRGVSLREIETPGDSGNRLFKESWETEKTELLKPGDCIKDVLRTDWQTVIALGTTHVTLADLLQRIVNSLSLKDTEAKMEFDPSALSKIGFTPEPQRLSFKYMLKTKGCMGVVLRCQDYVTIKNEKFTNTISINLDLIRLIREYGFYASGSARVDPLELVSILTGLDPKWLQQRVDSK